MTFFPVDFIIMDIGSKSSSPIILGRPFFRTRECQVLVPSQEVYETFSKKEDYGIEAQVSS
jgi:hypothetical protein